MRIWVHNNYTKELDQKKVNRFLCVYSKEERFAVADLFSKDLQVILELGDPIFKRKISDELLRDI
jgi:hypothetical protein